MATNRSGRNIALIIIAAMVIISLLYLLFFSKRYYNWSESYDNKADLPYGSFVFRELVDRSFSERTFIEIQDSITKEVKLDDLAPESNYFLIGREVYLDSSETSFLLEMVARGHHAFVISHSFSARLLDTILTVPESLEFFLGNDEDPYAPANLYQFEDTSIFMNLFDNEKLFAHDIECKFVRDHTPVVKGWVYFSDDVLEADGDPVEVLGHFNGHLSNFIRVTYGKGDFLLHATPLAFSNYQLLKKDGFEYVNAVTSHMGGGDIIWDEENRYYQHTPFEGSSNTYDFEHEEGPLTFILSQRSLRWAWFTLILLGLIYLVFGARRKQRAIPVIHAPENSSIDFAETIGTMFRMEHDHSKLTRMKMRLFRAHVRERYNLRTTTESPEQEQRLIALLAERSDLSEEEIARIFELYHQLEFAEDNDGRGLIRFHQKLETFYRNAR